MANEMPQEISRRTAILSGAATIGSIAASGPALALNNSQAKALVERVVSDINGVISSGKSLSGMISDFERIFRRYADVNIIARSTLGADARGLSSEQMRAYTDAFRSYIARKYGKRFREFVGGRVEVKTVSQVKSWHEVSTTVYLKGEAPFEVRFLVSDRSGQNLFFDMLIEGISLRLTERTEIGAMLDRNLGNVDKLIRDLRMAG